MSRKSERRQRIKMTVFLSLFLFAVNAVVLLLTIAVIYMLARFDVIKMTEGKVPLSHVLKFMFYTSIIIGIFITAFTGKITTKPLNRIVGQLDRLAKGDFKTRLHFARPISDNPTFQKIENSFNCAAEELEHTEMLRNDFINNFSHEFKTPIVSIAGFAKLIRHGNLTEEQKNEYLAVIEEESLRLSAMATNVLNPTKVENQTILTDVTNFNVSEQIRNVMLLLVDKWTAKNLYPDMQFGEHFIEGNEELLKQVWINLLDNAIKFSDENGTISVTITEDDTTVHIAVSNYGEAIPDDSTGQIFNKFYQADESHSSEGNGIGLAIVKKVCELHSGSVSAESKDGRTTFTVILPKKQQ